MELRTYSLRNYRVFEHLDLEVPAGLVGIYGPNGAGKSALLEAMTWALYGRARTSKQGIPTTGTSGECVVELGFDHDEHHYVIRRTISGLNHTVKARVTTAGQTLADGPTEVARYIRSLLGMDEHAFRSSVFAEQKQLAAFSDHTADHRRRLVLSLLGITPIEKARDDARVDARTAEKDYTRLLAGLPNTDELTARSAELDAVLVRQAAGVAQATESFNRLSEARRTLGDAVRLSEERHRQDGIIRAKGQAARKERDAALIRLGELNDEAQEIADGSARLDELEQLIAGFDVVAGEARVREIDEAEQARTRLKQLQEEAANADASHPPDPADVRQAEKNAAEVAAMRATSEAAREAAERELRMATAKLTSAASLQEEMPCPTCGQDIAGGVEAVIAHYQQEVEAASARRASAHAAVVEAQRVQAAVVADLDLHRQALVASETRWEHSRQVRSALQAARTEVERTAAVLGVVTEASWPLLAAERSRFRDQLAAAVAWNQEIARLRGRRERLERLELERADANARLAEADERRAVLRRELDLLAFDLTEHQTWVAKQAATEQALDAALAELRLVEATFAGASREQVALTARRDQIEEQRVKLGELGVRSVLLGRTAELLNGFRQSVVASVGPRLSAQASELFRLLTGDDYDGLQVDPETYEIQVIDQGVTFPTARFSGSEVDLANLALRVAISEQVRFQAGGQIGLLVLDEALASLDGDRKDRMLLALTQLSGRFRQILVVTHAVEVKEQLPQAIEIIKLGPRRSTARLVGGRY